MPVHAVEPRRHSAAARLEKDHAQFRVPLDDAAQIMLRHANIISILCDMMCLAARPSNGRSRPSAAAATLMEADREILLLGCAPERLVHRIVDQPVVVWVGPQEAATHAQFLARELHLLDRVLDGLHR